MKLKPFLLDQWLNQHQHSADKSIKYDLASSTGPAWTVREVVDLLGPDRWQKVLDAPMSYVHASGSTALREAIAQMEGVHPDNIQIVTGAAEGLLILFFLAAEPGANVVLPFPGYPPFDALPSSFGTEIRFYNVRRENGFVIDVDEIIGLTDANTKLVLVNSPHNPTGTTVSDQQIDALHDFTADRGIQLVIDQVYHPIYHGAETRSASRLPHATVLGDFSKALSLPGLRVGWIVERDRHRMEQYCDTRSYFTVSNTPVGEALAAAAVLHRDEIFSRIRRAAADNLTALDSFFSRMSGVLDWVRPTGGVTAFPWLIDGSDSRAMCKTAADSGLLLAPGDCWGIPDHFRLGFGEVEHGFTEALEILERVLGRAGRGRAGATS
ncbi:MAG TPA: aminotransferase class I/II-fold pyridoxal phosphate-dependent enzyme [Blastocatellia bacterium]